MFSFVLLTATSSFFINALTSVSATHELRIVIFPADIYDGPSLIYEK